MAGAEESATGGADMGCKDDDDKSCCCCCCCCCCCRGAGPVRFVVGSRVRAKVALPLPRIAAEAEAEAEADDSTRKFAEAPLN